MIHAQSVYLFGSEPTSQTNASTHSLVIDTKGAITGSSDSMYAKGDYLTVVASIARTNSATNTPSVFKLQTSNITDATGYADVSGSSFTSAVTNQSTSANNLYAWQVDLRPLKRYVKVLISPVTTQVCSVVGILSRAAGATPESTSTNTGTSVAPLIL